MIVALRWVALLCSFLLSGCSTAPPVAHEPKVTSAPNGKNKATIIVRRANADPLRSETAYLLFNGKIVAEIDNGHCANMTVRVGQHNLNLDTDPLIGLGGMLGTAIAEAFGGYNVNISPGQTLHYYVEPVYDGPEDGWRLATYPVPSGRDC